MPLKNNNNDNNNNEIFILVIMNRKEWKTASALNKNFLFADCINLCFSLLCGSASYWGVFTSNRFFFSPFIDFDFPLTIHESVSILFPFRWTNFWSLFCGRNVCCFRWFWKCSNRRYPIRSRRLTHESTLLELLRYVHKKTGCCRYTHHLLDVCCFFCLLFVNFQLEKRKRERRCRYL